MPNTPDTVVTDAMIEAGAKQMRAVIEDGYDDETAFASAMESIGVNQALDTADEGMVEGLVVRLTELAIMELDADEENSIQIEAFGAAVEKEIRAAIDATGVSTLLARVERLENALERRLHIYRTKRDSAPAFDPCIYNRQEAYRLVVEAFEIFAVEAGLDSEAIEVSLP